MHRVSISVFATVSASVVLFATTCCLLDPQPKRIVEKAPDAPTRNTHHPLVEREVLTQPAKSLSVKALRESVWRKPRTWPATARCSAEEASACAPASAATTRAASSASADAYCEWSPRPQVRRR